MIILWMPLSSNPVNLFFQLFCLELKLFCSLIFCCTNEKTYYTQIKRWKRYWKKEKEIKKEWKKKKKKERKQKGRMEGSKEGTKTKRKKKELRRKKNK